MSSIKPELIEALSVQIAGSFTMKDLDRIMLKTTGEGLFEVWVGANQPIQETAFELMQQVSRRGVGRVVLTEMLARRPQNEALAAAIDAACPEARQALPATGKQVAVLITGLDALRTRLADPEVRERLANSITGLVQIAEMIDSLYAYKSLHDCLHQLQAKQFRALSEAAKNLPTDLDQATELLAYCNQLLSACLSAREIVIHLPDTPPERRPTETLWIDALEAAGEQCHTAIVTQDSASARSALRKIRSIIRSEPQRLNGLIFTTSAALPLDDLTRALEDIGGEALPEIAAALGSLRTIVPTIRAGVAEHRKWQDVANRISDIDQIFEGSRTDLVEEFAANWMELKPIVQDLAARDPDTKWAGKLRIYTTNVDDRLAAEVADDAFRFAFDVWRGEAQFRFLMVDSKLKSDCEQLVRIGTPLHRILEELAP